MRSEKQHIDARTKDDGSFELEPTKGKYLALPEDYDLFDSCNFFFAAASFSRI